MSTVQRDCPPPTNNPLCLTHCPDCGYSLTGLPDRGLCPECGFAYDPDLIVLFGRASRGLGSLVTFSPAGLPRDINPMVAVIAVAFLISVIATQGLLFLLSTLLLSALAIGAVVLWRKSRRGDTLAPMQLRLTPNGCAKRSGWGWVQLTAWSPGHCIQIVPQNLRDEEPAGQYCCRITTAQTVGLNLHGPYLLEFTFDSTAEAARKIQQRLWDWGVRSI